MTPEQNNFLKEQASQKHYARLKTNTLNRLQLKGKYHDFLTPLKIERYRAENYENKPVDLREIVRKAINGGNSS